jgi:hypothetical protein
VHVAGCAATGLSDTAALVIQTEAKSEAVLKAKQVPPSAAANIDDPQLAAHKLAKGLVLSSQELLDLWRLRGRVQSSVQEPSGIDGIIRHERNPVRCLTDRASAAATSQMDTI